MAQVGPQKENVACFLSYVGPILYRLIKSYICTDMEVEAKSSRETKGTNERGRG